MRKIISFVAVCSIISLLACTNKEEKAKELYEKALQAETTNDYQYAISLYKKISADLPESKIANAPETKTRIQNAILAVVKNFKPAIDQETIKRMYGGKQTLSDMHDMIDKAACDLAEKIFSKRDAASMIACSSAKWESEEIAPNKWVVNRTTTGKDIYGNYSTVINSYKVDISRDIISGDEDTCVFIAGPDFSGSIKENAINSGIKDWSEIDWETECSFPLYQKK